MIFDVVFRPMHLFKKECHLKRWEELKITGLAKLLQSLTLSRGWHLGGLKSFLQFDWQIFISYPTFVRKYQGVTVKTEFILGHEACICTHWESGIFEGWFVFPIFLTSAESWFLFLKFLAFAPAPDLHLLQAEQSAAPPLRIVESICLSSNEAETPSCMWRSWLAEKISECSQRRRFDRRCSAPVLAGSTGWSLGKNTLLENSKCRKCCWSGFSWSWLPFRVQHRPEQTEKRGQVSEPLQRTHWGCLESGEPQATSISGCCESPGKGVLYRTSSRLSRLGIGLSRSWEPGHQSWHKWLIKKFECSNMKY